MCDVQRSASLFCKKDDILLPISNRSSASRVRNLQGRNQETPKHSSPLLHSPKSAGFRILRYSAGRHRCLFGNWFVKSQFKDQGPSKLSEKGQERSLIGLVHGPGLACQ